MNSLNTLNPKLKMYYLFQPVSELWRHHVDIPGNNNLSWLHVSGMIDINFKAISPLLPKET